MLLMGPPERVHLHRRGGEGLEEGEGGNGATGRGVEGSEGLVLERGMDAPA